MGSDRSLPKVHPRHKITRDAEIEFDGYVIDLMQKHKLTYAETFQMLATQINRLASSCLRAERRET